MTTSARAGSVLVIEDNHDLCELLAEILEDRGYTVEKAFTAREALASLRKSPPDLALVDLNLPDGRGMDVVAELQRRSPATTSIILTGNASLESAVEAVNRGAYAYLHKGGRMEDVLATIDRAAEKVRLERELREERSFSRAIVSSAPLGIAVFAADGTVLELNRRMRDLLGPGHAVVDRDAFAALGRDAAAQERLAATLAATLRTPAAIEVEVRRPDGAARTWVVSVSSVEGESRPEALVAVVADATAEKELQRKVLDTSRLAAIGEMAARVAHEIRNPLAGISGAIHVLGRKGESDETRAAFAKELGALVGRLNAFVEDLLVYARPLRITKQEVRLEALVEPIRANLRAHPVFRGVTVDVEDRLAAPLQLDAHHFGMALLNLVQNAAQAQQGRGRVLIEGAPGADGAPRIRVLDDGPGIAKGVLPRLFEAFTTTRIEGTGLGLSTSKRIVEAHGGTISAANRPEGGACFEIRLPG